MWGEGDGCGEKEENLSVSQASLTEIKPFQPAVDTNLSARLRKLVAGEEDKEDGCGDKEKNFSVSQASLTEIKPFQPAVDTKLPAGLRKIAGGEGGRVWRQRGQGGISPLSPPSPLSPLSPHLPNHLCCQNPDTDA
ncbi:MAG: hypothetical protein ACHBN1_33125 [Heteroscytonema crispum UTEX LB 1556]